MFTRMQFIAVGLLLAAMAPAWGATATLSGDTVSFAYQQGAAGKFGPATVQDFAGGSELSFTPGAFEIHVKKGSRELSRTFKLEVRANDGFQITGLELLQDGEYQVASKGKVEIAAKLKVVDHDNRRQRFTLRDGDTFKVAGGDAWSLSLDAGQQLLKPTSWVSVFITEELEAKGRKQEESWASLLSARLRVTTVATSSGGPVGGNPVPILPTFWLMGGGLLGLVGLRRRKA